MLLTVNGSRLPKRTVCYKSLQRQRVLSAWIPGLLTLKIQGSVPPMLDVAND